jgi:hypothetical protein
MSLVLRKAGLGEGKERKNFMPGMVACVYNLSTGEVEAGGFWFVENSARKLVRALPCQSISWGYGGQVL